MLQVVHGNAVDIVDERYRWEGLAANKDFQFWKDLGKAAHEQIANGAGIGNRKSQLTDMGRSTQQIDATLLTFR